VLAGSRNGTVLLFRRRDNEKPVKEKEFGILKGPAVRSVVLSPDERLAVWGTGKGQVQVARLPDGDLLPELWAAEAMKAHRDGVEAVAFRPDGRLLATGARDGRVCLWQREGETFRELLTLQFASPVASLTFTPDGHKLAVLVQNEYAVRLWDLDRLRARLAKMGLDW
jgi:WD40 repeat protein